MLPMPIKSELLSFYLVCIIVLNTVKISDLLRTTFLNRTEYRIIRWHFSAEFHIELKSDFFSFQFLSRIRTGLESEFFFSIIFEFPAEFRIKLKSNFLK
jgi:hypothetical protein